jgi:hypothetical protein
MRLVHKCNSAVLLTLPVIALFAEVSDYLDSLH